jgi:hypothetical protein
MESILTGIAILSLVFIPYYLFLKNGSSIKNKVDRLIKKEISSSGLNFTESESWSHNFLGIDKEAKKLFFVRVIEDKSESVLVDLSKIKQVRIEKKVEIDKENKNNSTLDKLDLVINFHPSGESIIHLFDSDVFYKELNEMKRAEDWVKKINTFRITSAVNQKAA